MLSVTLIVMNEAGMVRECLESVRFADEIVVLDSGSTDGTAEICREFGARVEVTDWPGFGPQKNRALDLATGDWILSIDADERVTPGLRDEIMSAITSAETAGDTRAADAYRIPRRSRLAGRWVRHSGWTPDYVVRLFRRGTARFSDNLVHESVVTTGPVGTFRNPLLHLTADRLEEVLEKVNRYSTAGAAMLHARGRRGSVATALLRGLWAFFRTYLLQLGFLDGSRGLMIAVSNAESSYYKHIKLMLLGEGGSR